MAFFCISNILPIAPSFAATAEHQCAIDVGISSGRTPLFTASSYGQVSLVQMLLDARAQVDAKNDDGPRAQIAVIASPSMRQKLHKVETVAAWDKALIQIEFQILNLLVSHWKQINRSQWCQILWWKSLRSKSRLGRSRQSAHGCCQSVAGCWSQSWTYARWSDP